MSSCHERDANYREERNQTIRPEHCRELAKLASGTTSSIIDTPHDLIYSLNILFSQFPNTRLFCPLLVRKLFISPCNCATKFDNEERENRPSARNKLQIAVIAGMRGSQLYIEAARLPRASVERLERILIGFPSNLIDTPHPERELQRRAGARLVSHASRSPNFAWLTDINGSRTRAKIFSAKLDRENEPVRGQRALPLATRPHASPRFFENSRALRPLSPLLPSRPPNTKYLRRDARLAVVDHTQKPLDENRKRNRDAQKLSRGARASFFQVF